MVRDLIAPCQPQGKLIPQAQQFFDHSAHESRIKSRGLRRLVGSIVAAHDGIDGVPELTEELKSRSGSNTGISSILDIIDGGE